MLGAGGTLVGPKQSKERSRIRSIATKVDLVIAAPKVRSAEQCCRAPLS